MQEALAGNAHVIGHILCKLFLYICLTQVANNDELNNRPDLISRVFEYKLKSLKHELLSSEIFGVVVGHQCIVEYQKRGLPHCHILLYLHPEHKPKSVADFDLFSSAELPNKDSNPKLHELVSRFEFLILFFSICVSYYHC